MISPRKLTTAALAVGLISLSATAQAEPHKRFIVEYEQGKRAAIAELVNKKRGRIAKALENLDAMAVELSSAEAAKLAQDKGVLSISEDVKRYPMMMDYSVEQVPYSLSMAQLDQLSDAAAGDLTVCVIDTGYDLGHPDLPSASVDGHIDAQAGAWYHDEVGHGTHVAGTLAALKNGEGVVGALPGGQLNLFIVKAFNAQGWAYSSTLVDALEQCQDAGAKVVNLSLGGPDASRLEQRAFAKAYRKGVLSIAAAGNEGDTFYNYPASYDSVVSVGAVFPDKSHAVFSQRNDQVELTAPGYDVLSTVLRGQGRESTVAVKGSGLFSLPLENTVDTAGTPVSAPTVNCGIGDQICSDAKGKICLIERGGLALIDKVMHCELGGGVGAVIYNNAPGPVISFIPPAISTIPAVGIFQTDGQALVAEPGIEISLEVLAVDYARRHGTSMAAPHVAGAAALLWSQPGNKRCSAREIRQALTASAQDLGEPGRDPLFGYGFLQSAAAAEHLANNPCRGKRQPMSQAQYQDLKSFIKNWFEKQAAKRG